jgi:hypothetical protein
MDEMDDQYFRMDAADIALDELKKLLRSDAAFMSKWQSKRRKVNRMVLVASSCGMEDFVETALLSGANANVQDSDGNTPLHRASMHGHLGIVDLLLRSGGDIFKGNNKLYHPIDMAALYGESEVAKPLLQHYYAALGPFALSVLFDDLTERIDWADPKPLRLFLVAKELTMDDVVEIIAYVLRQNVLRQRPSLLLAQDKEGSLPLHLACRQGVSFTIVRFLIDLYPPSVKRVTPQGDLPLFLACNQPEPSLDIVYLLMRMYPDLVSQTHTIMMSMENL